MTNNTNNETSKPTPIQELEASPKKCLDLLMQAARDFKGDWNSHVLLQTAGRVLDETLEGGKESTETAKVSRVDFAK